MPRSVGRGPSLGPELLRWIARAVAPGARVVNERRVTVRPRRARTIEWRTSDGWYDVTITTAEDAAFLRRLAGHIENGRPSVTG